MRGQSEESVVRGIVLGWSDGTEETGSMGERARYPFTRGGAGQGGPRLPTEGRVP